MITFSLLTCETISTDNLVYGKLIFFFKSNVFVCLFSHKLNLQTLNSTEKSRIKSKEGILNCNSTEFLSDLQDQVFKLWLNFVQMLKSLNFIMIEKTKSSKKLIKKCEMIQNICYGQSRFRMLARFFESIPHVNVLCACTRFALSNKSFAHRRCIKIS